METDFSCGIIPVVHDGLSRRYLLVQHLAGHWGFPKGHPERGESPIRAALRELSEETGLGRVDLLKKPAFEERYRFRKRSGRVVIKSVVYHLGRVQGGVVRAQPEELADIAWGDARATARRMTFNEGRALLAEVERFITAGGAARVGL